MFIPTAIFIESGLEASPLALRARSLAPAASVSSFPDLTALASALEALPVEEAKRRLVIARRAGGFVKEFPDGTGVRQSGWRYFIPAIGCPADCRYCFLQTWHAAGAPMLFADGPAMLAEIESTARSLGGGYFYGGELCDNLLLEPYLAQVGDLVSLFRRLPDATLELRTKSDDIAPLLAAGPAPNVVVSWTFTPQSVVEAYEPGTAPLDARIAAAARAQQAGFRIGLRFDPLVLDPGWPEAYAALIARLSAALDSSLIESAHLGCLRFPPAFKAFAAARFTRSAPFDAEFILGVDGKLHYPRPTRAAAYAAVWRLLAAWDDGLKVRLVMETPSVEADTRRLLCL